MNAFVLIVLITFFTLLVATDIEGHAPRPLWRWRHPVLFLAAIVNTIAIHAVAWLFGAFD